MAGLERVVCHPPYFKQNRNMADQNEVGSAIRLTNTYA